MKALTKIFAFLFFVMLINPVLAQAFPDVDESHWAYKEIIEASMTHDFEYDEKDIEIWK